MSLPRPAHHLSCILAGFGIDLLGVAAAGLFAGGLRSDEPKSAASRPPPQATAPALPAAAREAALPPPAAPPPPTLEQQRVHLLIQQVEARLRPRRGRLSQGKIARGQGGVRSRRGSDADQRHRHQERCRVAGGVRPHCGRGERAGDGGAEAGQRLCAQGGADAGRCGRGRDLRGGPQHCGQGQGRPGHDQVRSAAGGQRLRGRLHQLLCQHQERPQHAAALL